MSEVISSQTTIILETLIIFILTVLNIVFLSLSSAMLRFLFALFTLVLASTLIANSYIPFHPYLQLMAVVMSLICMVLAARVRG